MHKETLVATPKQAPAFSSGRSDTEEGAPQTEGAPRTAALIILASLEATEAGSPPRSGRRVEQDQAATRQLQPPVVPLHQRRWYRTAYPSPSLENRSSISGVTASSIPFSPLPG